MHVEYWSSNHFDIVTLFIFSCKQINKQTNDSNDIYLFKYFSYLLWFTAIRTVLVVNGHQNIWFYIYGSVHCNESDKSELVLQIIASWSAIRCAYHMSQSSLFFLYWMEIFFSRACWSHVFLGALEKRHAYFSSIGRIYLMTEWDGSNDDSGPKKNNIDDLEIKSSREKLYRIIILVGYIFYLHGLPVTISTSRYQHNYAYRTVSASNQLYLILYISNRLLTSASLVNHKILIS